MPSLDFDPGLLPRSQESHSRFWVAFADLGTLDPHSYGNVRQPYRRAEGDVAVFSGLGRQDRQPEHDLQFTTGNPDEIHSQAVTGLDDIEVALSILESHNWQLEVYLYHWNF